jgi:hypothetical protein
MKYLYTKPIFWHPISRFLPLGNLRDEERRASGEKLKSDSTFPSDFSVSQPFDTSIDTSDRTTGENIPNSAAPSHTRSHI